MSILSQQVSKVDQYFATLQSLSEPVITNKQEIEFYKAFADKKAIDYLALLLKCPDTDKIDDEYLNAFFHRIYHAVGVDDCTEVDVVSILREDVRYDPFDTLLDKNYIVSSNFRLFLVYVYTPLSKMISYSEKIRGHILSESKEINTYLDGPVEAGEVYDALRFLENEYKAADVLCSVPNCPKNVSDCLIAAYQSSDKELFCRLSTENNVDYSELKGLCFAAEVEKEFAKAEKDFDVDGKRSIDSVLEVMRFCQLWDDDSIDEESKSEKEGLASAFEKLKSFLKDVSNSRGKLDQEALRGLLKNIPILENVAYFGYKSKMRYIQKLSPEEQRIFASVLERPEGQVYVDIFNARYNRSQQKAPNKVPSFSIPRDFMELPIHEDNNEFFLQFDSKICELGPRGLEDLLKLLESRGFINGDRDKHLFVYRLSGRMRPDDFCAMDKITWHADDCKELLYLIQKLYGRIGDKYIRAKDFFECKEWWPEHREPGNYAQEVKVGFKKSLHNVNGDVFPEPQRRI